MTTTATLTQTEIVVVDDTAIQVITVGQQGPTGAQGATGAAGSQGAAGQGVPTGGTAGQVLSKIDSTNYNTRWVSNSSTPAWGTITGTLSSQTDLQTALNAKQNSITTGTTAQYFRGDLSLATFPTAVSAFTNDAAYITSSASITGNAATATKLATARTISISGDLAYTSPSFDGSGNVTAAGTLATVNSNVGTFNNVTVNGKGLVTGASNVSYQTPLTFSTGLTNSSGTVTVNTSQNIATLSNLTGNGFVKTSGGTGTLSVDTNSYVNTSTLGANNGTATLDSSGKLTSSQIPAALVGAVVYQGTWNATTNSPTLASGTGSKGNYYKVATAGSTTIDGISQWNIGDTIIFDGTTWDKIDGIANEVISVAGKTGVISLVVGDISGAVSAVTVASANGFTGTSSGGTTPALTIATSITGLLKGNGTAISAATAGTDYLVPFGSQTANTFYAAPNGSSGTPSFRAIVAADIPTLNQNTTGNAATVTTNANLTGDLTSVGNATTLATVNTNVGSYGGITLNAKGLATAAIQPTSHDACRVAVTANITGTYSNGSSGVGATITYTATGALVIDGVTMNLNDPVCVNQPSANLPWNGFYTVTNAGSVGVSPVLTRRSDFDNSTPLSIREGATVFISEGTSNAGALFGMNVNGTITLGTTAITFVTNQAGGVIGGYVASVSNADGTLTISPTTGAVVASLNLAHANTWSAAQTISAAGAASTPSLSITGAVYTAGTATTNTPLVYLNNGATAPTTWSTAGTHVGINAVNGFAGNFLDFHLNGSASLFKVDSTGSVRGATFNATNFYASNQLVSTWAGQVSFTVIGTTGALLTGGTGTTNFPQYLAQPSSATAVTTWSTSGTFIGVNSASGFTGNFLDFHVNGGSSVTSIGSTGNIVTTGNITGSTFVASAAQTYLWSGRTRITSPADGSVLLANNATTGFTLLQLGPTVAAPTAVTIQPGSVVAGTADTAGVTITFIGSLSTGAGTSGDIIFQTGGTGAASTAQNTATTAMTIKGATQVVNFAAGITASTATFSGTVNKVTITAPATGSTLTIADGKTLTMSNTLSFTGTDSSSVAFGAGGTVTYTSNNLGAFAATTSAQLAGVISDETGSGALVFANSPTLVTPTLGVATATSINKVTITAPATSATLTVADGKTFTASNTLTFTGTDGSSVAFGTGGTVAYTSNNLSVFSATTSAQLAGVISDETGSGALVFATSPTLVTPTLGVATASSISVTSSTVPVNGLYLPAANTLGFAANTTDTGIRIESTGAIYGYAAKINAQTGTTYTLVAGDSGKIIEFNNASAITLTFPNSLPVGFQCRLVQTGAGQVTFSAASGATLRNYDSYTKLAGQYSQADCYVTANSGGASAIYNWQGRGA